MPALVAESWRFLPSFAKLCSLRIRWVQFRCVVLTNIQRSASLKAGLSLGGGHKGGKAGFHTDV